MGVLTFFKTQFSITYQECENLTVSTRNKRDFEAHLTGSIKETPTKCSTPLSNGFRLPSQYNKPGNILLSVDPEKHDEDSSSKFCFGIAEDFAISEIIRVYIILNSNICFVRTTDKDNVES